MNPIVNKSVFKEEYRENIINNIEVWASLKELGFSNYRVSSFGKFRHINKNTDHGTCLRIDGYIDVRLNNDNCKGVSTRVHRLLALTFIEKPSSDKRLSVDHIDRNSTNNNLNNLRWATNSEQRINSNRDNVRMKGGTIIQSDKIGGFVKKWSGIDEILDSKPSYKRGVLSDALGQLQKTAYGYIWKYDQSCLKGETWKYHPVHSHIQVSTHGRIMNMLKRKVPMLGSLSSEKYRCKINRKSYSIHKLVAETFIDGYDGEELIHVNGNGKDNRLKNIQIREEYKKQKKRKEEKRRKKEKKRKEKRKADKHANDNVKRKKHKKRKADTDINNDNTSKRARK